MCKRKFICYLVFLLALLLCACGEGSVEETASPETVTAIETTQPTPTTVPETEPPTEPPVETEPPTEPVAELISEGVKVLVDGGDYTVSISDGSHLTLKTIYNTQKLEVVSDTPFSSLYITWSEVPGGYAVLWEGGSVECGQYDFLHEYVRLPEATTHVEFSFAEGKYKKLCDIEVLTAGTAPEGVQDWLPPCEEADILVFPTHSDDDVLFFGPLMAYYAVETEYTVQTAFMVDHAFYPERAHERLNGLWAMGIRHYPILGKAPDSPIFDFGEAMAFYATSNIERWQVEQIRRFKPLVVVGHDLRGEYGNGGHKVNAHYLVKAIASSSDPEAFPDLAEQYGTWETPKLYLHLYEENEILIDVEVSLQNDPQGRSPFDLATEAYQFHVSQHKWPYRVQFGEDRDFDCRPFGLYHTLVGLDTKADIMDNIDPAAWRNED